MGLKSWYRKLDTRLGGRLPGGVPRKKEKVTEVDLPAKTLSSSSTSPKPYNPSDVPGVSTTPSGGVIIRRPSTGEVISPTTPSGGGGGGRSSGGGTYYSSTGTYVDASGQGFSMKEPPAEATIVTSPDPNLSGARTIQRQKFIAAEQDLSQEGIIINRRGKSYDPRLNAFVGYSLYGPGAGGTAEIRPPTFEEQQEIDLASARGEPSYWITGYSPKQYKELIELREETIPSVSESFEEEVRAFKETSKIFDEKYSSKINEKNEFVGSEQEYNCLLYTSPSPRDLSTSRMPSSA